MPSTARDDARPADDPRPADDARQADDARTDDARTERRDLVTVLLLSVTAILTAWAGFQASQWGGEESIAFSRASSERIAAVRLESDANRTQTVQVGLFTAWLQAYQGGDTQLADFLAARFPEPLATTFPQWLASKPLQNPDAAKTPFELPDYVIPALEQSKQSNARADASFARALRYDDRGDVYTLLTVAFATVLFFAALSGRMRDARVSWGLLGLAIAGFAVLTVLLVALPRQL